MDKLNLNKENLRKFGITMALVFLVITVIILLRHRQSILLTFIISAVFFVLAAAAPVLLKPVYIFWMKFAFVLGWINTRIILFIIFYLIFAPIGLMMRLFGVDLLDRRIEKGKDSYWKKKEKRAFGLRNYEKQF